MLKSSNEELREYLAVHSILHNEYGDFSKSLSQYLDRNRGFSKNICFKKLVNENVVKKCYVLDNGNSFSENSELLH